ncbi:MAG: hypothetical protein HUU46_20185 [Candidatus Hydrogenedentes bacterium]|nr:hypothetical protein [Candidatus Hydrogenedentota bacterium]
MWRAAGIVLCAACAACSPPPEKPGLFEEGERLYLEGNYSAAAQAFKSRLLEKPDDAGAHFYLGTCYLYDKKNNWLGIAQGELETALSLFERQGKVSPVPRFDAEYFEIICHVNKAKIYLLLVSLLIDNSIRYRDFRGGSLVPAIIEKCEEEARRAERVSATHPDVVWLRQELKKLTDEFGPMLRPRATPVPQFSA